jgi:hypothetical protein
LFWSPINFGYIKLFHPCAVHIIVG